MAAVDSRPYGIVYCIVHRESGRAYIGQTITSLQERWRRHCTGKPYCVRLRRAIDAHGADAFDVFELDAAGDKSELDALEDFYIRLFGTIGEHGYNLRGGGSFGKHSAESRKKMSEKVRAAFARPEIKAKLSATRRGKPHSAAHTAAVALAVTGKRHSTATRSRLSEVAKALWADEQTAQRMASASKAAREAQEFRDQVAANSRKQWSDPEARARLMAARAATQEKGNEARRAAWRDPDKKAARLAKLRATLAAKKSA